MSTKMPKTVFPIRRNPAGKRMVKAFLYIQSGMTIMQDLAKVWTIHIMVVWLLCQPKKKLYDERFFVAAGGVSNAQQHGYRTTHSIAYEGSVTSHAFILKHTNFQLEVILGILLQQKKHITTLESELKEHGRVIGELVYKWQLGVYMVAQASSEVCTFHYSIFIF